MGSIYIKKILFTYQQVINREINLNKVEKKRSKIAAGVGNEQKQLHVEISIFFSNFSLNYLFFIHIPFAYERMDKHTFY